MKTTRKSNDPGHKSNDNTRTLDQLHPEIAEEYMGALKHLLAARDAGRIFPNDFAGANDRLYDAYHGSPRNRAFLASRCPAPRRRGK